MKFILPGIVAIVTLLAGTAAANDFAYDPDRDAIGRTYVYTRSNSDGTMAETIAVHRAAADRIEVTKTQSRCTRAAFVWAELDTATMTTPRITGGRLLPGAEHLEFGFLTHDPEARQINIEFRLPDQTVTGQIPVEGRNWHLYDYDLASLTVVLPHLSNPENGFAFEAPLVWADLSSDDVFRNLGNIEATFDGEETVSGTRAYRYSVSGGASGTIWIDAAQGHILRAVLDQPNHPGYADFQLVLEEIADEGAAGWQMRMRSHFEGCEN